MTTMADVLYLNTIEKVLQFGTQHEDRTGVGTRHLTTPCTLDFDMRRHGFPVLEGKTVFWKGAIAELIWMGRGSTNARDLSEILYGDRDKPNFWTPNADNQGKALGYQEGELGPVYGKQLTDFLGVNQLDYVLSEILKGSRRAVISMWNPADLDKMALPPCHYTSVFMKDGEYLNLTMLMRSNDLFLGAPFNHVFYQALLQIMSLACGLKPGTYSHISVDTHIYNNHMAAIETYMDNVPSLGPLNSPKLVLTEQATTIIKGAANIGFKQVFDTLELKDFQLLDYSPKGVIK